MRALKGQDEVTSANGRNSSRYTEPTRLPNTSGARAQCVYPVELSLFIVIGHSMLFTKYFQ